MVEDWQGQAPARSGSLTARRSIRRPLGARDGRELGRGLLPACGC